MAENLYRITTKWACFGIVVKNMKVIDAAPMGRKSIGRWWPDVKKFYKVHWQAKVEKLY